MAYAEKRNGKLAMLTCLFALFTASDCWAQQTSAEAFEQLGKQLEEIQQVLTPPPLPPERGRTGRRPPAVALAPYEPIARGAIETAIKTMEQTVRQFRDNQWVRVKGFHVTVGLSPSVVVDFEVPQSAGSAAR